MKKRSFLKSDEQIKTFAAFCIVLGVVLLVGSGLFDHIIGGNAVRGYHKEEVYMVYELCIYLCCDSVYRSGRFFYCPPYS